MASIEFLQQRVAGKEAELTKLNKKMDRILKAEESGWQNNPYYYNEYDKKHTTKDIEACEKALADYREKLSREQEKVNSRNVQVILDFLEDWKTRVRNYHIASVPLFLEARSEWHKIDHEYCEWFNHDRIRASKEEYQQRNKERKEAEKEYRSAWSWIFPYMETDTLNIEKLDKDLDKEANAKYDDIIERTNDIVGTITDAGGLRIGKKGNLNGIIIGDRGRAKVQTIGAGGYNIQCYHFRTLIHKEA